MFVWKCGRQEGEMVEVVEIKGMVEMEEVMDG